MKFDLDKLRKPVPLPVSAKLKGAGVCVGALAQMFDVSSDYLSRVLNGHSKGSESLRLKLRQLEEQLG